MAEQRASTCLLHTEGGQCRARGRSHLGSFGLLQLLKLLEGRAWCRRLQGKIPNTSSFPHCRKGERERGQSELTRAVADLATQ